MIHNYRHWLLTGNAESLHPSQSCILSQSIFFLLMVAILCKNSFWESKNICTIWENIHCVCTTKQSLMAEQIFLKHAILKLFFPSKIQIPFFPSFYHWRLGNWFHSSNFLFFFHWFQCHGNTSIFFCSLYSSNFVGYRERIHFLFTNALILGKPLSAQLADK